MNPIHARSFPRKHFLAAAIMVAVSSASSWNPAAALTASPLEAVVNRALPSIARVVLSGTFINKDGKSERHMANGTAFVTDDLGHLLTNCHVLTDNEHVLVTRTVQVVFADDQTRYDAEVVGCDGPSDLGMLHVPALAGKRKPLMFAKTSTIRLGQDVVAIGFAKNLDGLPTITRGIVSGFNRTLHGEFSDLVQTDAVINHGNSGGPLMNMDGDVIGVNTYIYAAPKKGADGTVTFVEVPGIYMARGAGTAAAFSRKLVEKGEIYRADLGLSGASFDRWDIDALRLPKIGMLVKDVKEGSIAARAGIPAGAVIHAVTFADGLRWEVRDLGSLNDALALAEAGETVRFHFIALNAQGNQAIADGVALTPDMVEWFYADAKIPAPAKSAAARRKHPLPVAPVGLRSAS